MKKGNLILLGVLIVVVLLSVVFNKKNDSSDVVKIGVMSGFTGPGAGTVYGEPIKRGIDMVIEELNKDGKKYEVFYEDYAVDTKQALPAYNALKLRGIKHFIIDGSPAAAVVGPEAVKDGNLSFVPTAFLASYKDGNSLTCRAALTAESYPPYYLDILKNKLKVSKVAVLIPNYEAGVSLEEEMRKVFEPEGIEIVIAERYLKDTGDFRTEVAKIASKKDVQAILAFNYFQTVEPMFKQMQDLGIKLPIISDNWTIKNPSLQDTSLVEGAYFVDYDYSADGEEGSSKSKEFISNFEEKFGTKPGLQSVQGYDMTKILAYAIENAKSKKPEDVTDFMINKMGDYDAVGGNISFNSDCEAKRSSAVRRIIQGAIVTDSK